MSDAGINLPFLKWAGGKRWLVSAYPQILPDHFDVYLEPFLGGGSVFFHLRPNHAILSDANRRLIECYFELKHRADSIEEILRLHHINHSEEYYYNIRSTNFARPVERAAQFIYLNRTCWNGLYRVNLQGDFNVPVGTKNTVIFPEENFSYYKEILSEASLFCNDFEATIEKSRNGDFVFVDPPYTVKHNMNGFIKYNEKISSWDDQISLSNSVRRAASRGVKLLITNADHPSVWKLYRGVGHIIKLERYSVLAAAKDAREKINEIAITINYEPANLSY